MVTQTVHVSDLSGETDAAPAIIGLDRTWYEVDLTSPEQEELQRLLEPYLRSGRRIGSTLNKKRTAPETTVEEREEIRAWAKENGFSLAEYGRIPKKILAAHRGAHQTTADRQ